MCSERRAEATARRQQLHRSAGVSIIWERTRPERRIRPSSSWWRAPQGRGRRSWPSPMAPASSRACCWTWSNTTSTQPRRRCGPAAPKATAGTGWPTSPTGPGPMSKRTSGRWRLRAGLPRDQSLGSPGVSPGTATGTRAPPLSRCPAPLGRREPQSRGPDRTRGSATGPRGWDHGDARVWSLRAAGPGVGPLEGPARPAATRESGPSCATVGATAEGADVEDPDAKNPATPEESEVSENSWGGTRREARGQKKAPANGGHSWGGTRTHDPGIMSAVL